MKASLIFSLLVFTMFLITPSMVFAQEPLPGPLMPGIVEGIGTHFEITDSEYLDIILDSSEEIKLRMESIPEMITIMIEPVSLTTSSQITISGFLPNTTYYKYQDDYHNLTEFIADNNGAYSYIQDTSAPHFIFIQPRKSAKFIRDDATGGQCTSIGTWDPSTKTCTLTIDLYETIQIDSNNIALDGNNHTITGTGTGYGVYLYGKTGVTIKNLSAKNFTHGIYLSYSNNNIFLDNSAASNNYSGISIYSSNNNTFTNNTTNLNNYYGAYFSFSDDNIFNNNVAKENNYYDIYVYASSNVGCNNAITNTIGSGDRPIKYYHDDAINLADEIFSELILCNADNSNINNITIDGSATKQNNTLLLMQTDSSNLANINSSNNAYGIDISLSNNNIIIGNTTNSNKYYGISIWSSVNNVIKNNAANFNNNYRYSGIGLSFSNSNIITGNAITNNYYGVRLVYSNNNKTYHNNIIDNYYKPQAYLSGGTGNLFDNGYPDGGNYWSDYTGQDQYSGPDQDEPGPDGIGDTPYVFYYSGQDRYPFMGENGWAEKTLSEKAADLAKELVNSNYLVGGKGWDFKVKQFVPVNNTLATSSILGGYNYATSAGVGFDDGVDCSGLVMWSYDRSFDPNKSRFNNFVTVEKADQQYRYNSTSTTEAQLQPGDVMFFNNDSDPEIDHVAMFVGESGGYDVVNARSPRLGIRGMLKDMLKATSTGFVGFKRIVQGPPPSILVSLGSPADLIVTDPDGFTITPTTTIPSDVEELREIPGILYYSEMEQGADGRPADQVYSYIAKTGDYKIQVIPEPDALPTDKYSLFFTTDLATTTVLADDILISDIPTQPYLVRLTEGVAEKIIPIKVEIMPRTLNLGNEGLFSVHLEISKGFGVTIADIDATTIEIQGVKTERTAIADDKSLIAFFKTQNLNTVIEENGDAELKITGKLKDGTKFEGADTIRLISKGRFSVSSFLLANLHEVLSKLLEMLQGL